MNYEPIPNRKKYKRPKGLDTTTPFSISVCRVQGFATLCKVRKKNNTESINPQFMITIYLNSPYVNESPSSWRLSICLESNLREMYDTFVSRRDQCRVVQSVIYDHSIS